MFDGRMAVASKSAERIEFDSAPPASVHGPDLPDIPGSYGRYISSGLYDRRYPRPNRRTLRKMKQCLPAGGALSMSVPEPGATPCLFCK